MSKLNVPTITNLSEVLEKKCPVLVHVPEGEVNTLSQAFNDENVNSDSAPMTEVGQWMKKVRKGLHAELTPETWPEFEQIVTKLAQNGLQDKTDIAYEGRVIGYRNAFCQTGGTNILDNNWGNGTGPYVLYDDKKTRIGMVRLFPEKEGHLSIKIPFRHSGENGIHWNDITPRSVRMLSTTHSRPKEFTHSGFIASQDID